jgi:hypothetical protein
MVVAKRAPVVPEPRLIRRIEGSFAWIDHRLIREGHLERMTVTDLAVYVFLVLVADRTGTSFYRKDVTCRKLGIDWGAFEESKARLLEKGLIAFRPFRMGDVDGFYQILPIPQGGGR